MSNRPEVSPVIGTGGQNAVQQVLLAITRFMQQPPGLARVTYDSSLTRVSVQVTNRAGAANDGVWLILVYRLNSSGVPVDLVPSTPANGSILETLPGTSYLCVTDERGLLSFDCGAPPSTGQTVHAMCLGEPTVKTI